MSDVVSEDHGAVRVITLNRPDRRNAINSGMARGLLDALVALDSSDAMRVGVLTGAGAGFCAGMDLRAFAADGLPDGLQELLSIRARKPLVAAVEGFALGGGFELALLADIIVAGADAQLGSPEVTLGMFPTGGAPLRLPRHVGYGRAALLFLTGTPIASEDAHAAGIVTHLADAGGALPAAMDIAHAIAAHPADALVTTKSLLRSWAGVDDDGYWRAQEADVTRVLTSAEVAEGVDAALNKRSPSWR